MGSSAMSAFYRNLQIRLIQIQSPASFQGMIESVPDTRSIRIPRKAIGSIQCSRLLFRMTPCQFIRPLPSYKPMRTIILLVQQEISPTCQPGTSRQIYHTTQPFQEMFLSNDINDTNITLGIMFGRRRCNNLYILNLSGRNLFQSLRSGKDTGLSIYINQKPELPRKVTSPSASTRIEGVFSKMSTAEPPLPIILEEASTTFLSSLYTN